MFPDVDDQKSFALRLIIHYVGDLHQPLHATAEVDSYYPHGDAGGNYEHLPSDPETGVSNLHQVWDSVIYGYCGWETLPLDRKGWAYYSATTEQLQFMYPVDEDLAKITDFSVWAHESFEMSATLVYPNFVYDTKPDADYIASAKPALEQRVVLAGNRLAKLVEAIYSPSNIENVALFLQ